ADANSFMLPHAFVLVKHFFQKFSGRLAVFPSASVLSPKRSVNIPDTTPLVNYFFQLFSVFFCPCFTYPIFSRFPLFYPQDMALSFPLPEPSYAKCQGRDQKGQDQVAQRDHCLRQGLCGEVIGKEQHSAGKGQYRRQDRGPPLSPSSKDHPCHMPY